MPTSARCWDFGRPSVGADDLTDAPNFGTKFGWRKPCPRYIGPSKAPLCKGSWHGAAVTEGLSEVAGHFGDDLCRDSNPFLPSAAQTLRCAPLAWVVAGTSPSLCRGGPVCPPVGGCREGACPGRHIGRPLPGRWKPPSTPGRTGGDGAPPLREHRKPPVMGRCV